MRLPWIVSPAVPSLLALADAAWSRLPLPARFVAREVRVGPLPALEMYRAVAGRPVMKVYAYAVGDTLVDTGLVGLGRALLAWARGQGIRAALLTHHHEDHAGNAAALAAAGVPVHGTPLTDALLRADLPIPFYEHLAWGRPPRAAAVPFPAALALDGAPAEVLDAPGHCVDQVCLWVPSRGWLFSGDAFLHERVRLFRRDEDFAASVATLERLCALPVEALFCAHRPVLTHGDRALAAKLQHLRDVEGRVRALHARGLPVRAIARELRLGRSVGFQLLSAGDASTTNLVRSILRGPVPRREVAAVTARLGG